MLDVSNVHILGPVYYHATHERAEVMNRVHYTTWIKSQGEAERVLCVCKLKKSFIFKAYKMDAYQKCW